MNPFLEWLSRLLGSWKPWVVVAPWDVGVRIRLGRVARELKPGPHLRIPFVDDVVLVNTRIRSCSSSPVSIESDGMVEVRSAMALFAVSDPVLAMMNFSRPEDVVSSLLSAEVSRCRLAEDALAGLRAATDGKGIRIDSVRFLENARMRAYRLFQGGGGIPWSGPSSADHSTPVRVF